MRRLLNLPVVEELQEEVLPVQDTAPLDVTHPADDLLKTISAISDAEAEGDEEADLGDDADAIAANADQQQETAAVMESLHLVAEQLKTAREGGKLTAELLTMSHFAAEQQLLRLNEQLPSLSLEAEATLEQQSIALEAVLGTIWKRIAQEWVMGSKHSWNAINDFFQTLPSKVSKYEGKLKATEVEFDQVKGKFNEKKHTGVFNQLWYFFRTGEGQPDHDLMGKLTQDLAMSQYALKTYPAEVMKIGHAIRSKMAGKVSSMGDLVELAGELEKIKHPAELFNQKLLGGKPYFNVTGLEFTQGSKRTALTVEGTSLSKLADLATAKRVEESGSFGHGALKVAAQVGGGYSGAVEFVLSKSFEYSTEEIGKLIAAGMEYVENVKSFSALDKQFGSMLGELDTTMVTLLNNLKNAGEGVDNSQARALVKQIEQVVDNVFTCFSSPAQQEVSRSLRAAKYCHYMALRMIYNAK